MSKETEAEKRRRLACRACTNGWGDGCCSYHARKFDIKIKRVEKQTKRRDR